jgi:subtilisin family serine protease
VPKRQRFFGSVVGGYASYNGTSMATPHVSGAAALYKAYHPDATAAEVKAAILGAAVPTPSLQGRVLTNGRLNVSGF